MTNHGPDAIDASTARKASTTLAGYASDHFGSQFAFLGLAAVAAAGLAAVWLLLPETRPERPDAT